ncbi:surface polysaccharide O-acyltransferase-like enzyme [Bacilli bacterium PM5-3]|nr:surface polysaccharide O-acyltransferase-like enzyme [Bacilli bacterium PM5-3]MDH6603352.1 surface polysaccharide O-acyltransferase-like enzyme [Bacilli bacterium PM5-9]
MENKNRVYYYDGLRVLCAALVVMLHSISIRVYGFNELSDTVWTFMNSVNAFTRVGVSVFFMISGALLLSNKKNNSYEYVIKHRVVKVIVQLLIFSVFYAFVYGKVLDIENYSLISFFKGFLTNDIELKFWFLYVLIGLYLSTPIFRIIVEKADRKYLWYLVALSIVGRYLFYDINTILNLKIRFEIPIASSFVGVFILGYLLSTMTIEKKKRYILYLIGFLACLFRIYMTNMLSVNEGKLVMDWMSNPTFNVLISSIALFVFAKESKMFEKISKTKVIQELSKLTLGIYLFHPVIIKYVVHTRNWKSANMEIYHVIALFLIAFIGAIIISFILSKIKYVKNLIS